MRKAAGVRASRVAQLSEASVAAWVLLGRWLAVLGVQGQSLALRIVSPQFVLSIIIIIFPFMLMALLGDGQGKYRPKVEGRRALSEVTGQLCSTHPALAPPPRQYPAVGPCPGGCPRGAAPRHPEKTRHSVWPL